MAAPADAAGVSAAPARYALTQPASARLRLALALLGGAALAGAFAPLNLWPLAILSPALLMWLWQDASPREAARLGFCFNFATFAAGTYWLYISIHGFGNAPIWLALFLMLGLVAIMALYHAALGYAVARWLPERGALRWLLALPAAWLLVEWWRGWFLSGFSWLSLGYSQSDTWLAGFAPLIGVYGISALLLICAGALVALACAGPRVRIIAACALLAPWAAGAALYRHSWTSAAGPALEVAVVQGAIPQDEKWQESNRNTTLALYQSLTEQVLATQGVRLIVWPESAPADVANDIVPYITHLYREARAHGAALVLGVLRAERAPGEDTTRYFNSVLALDDKVSWYDKHHLVPFAEFFPVPQFVRTLDAPDEPAVLGLHPRARRAAATGCRAPAARHHRVLRGRLRQLDAECVAARRRSGERHQRRLVRPFERPLPALPDRPHARARGRPLPGARGQRRRFRSHRPARRSHRPRPGIQARGAGLINCPLQRADALRACWKLAGGEPGDAGAGIRAVGAE